MEVMIEIDSMVKSYKLYSKPIDRLKEAISFTKNKYHQNFAALNGISLSVMKGEALGVLGKNGSGKSTLLKLITGVLSPSSGNLKIHGKVSAILELGAGFNPEYTGRENIYMNGLMMGYSREQMTDRIQAIIDFADIGDFIDQPVKVYSSGMFARLAFAVSINVDPDILIVDEALAVGDIRFQTKCIDKMKELKARGATILFVSHATEQVKRFCNRAIWLMDGQIVMDGEASHVVDSYEDYMKNNTIPLAESSSENKIQDSVMDFEMPENYEFPAYIQAIHLNKSSFKTFDTLEVEVVYDIYEEKIDDFLIGVAIYTPDREYIFGPNTYLENVQVPRHRGRHSIKYVIPKLSLLSGTYSIDVGVFNNEGLVCLNYKQDAERFTVTNNYFSEGLVYMEHRWEVQR